jgi:hypothetical protein
VIVTIPATAGANLDSALESDVAASSWLSVRASEMGSLRSQAAAAYPDTLAMSMLKQADDQGLVALLALRQAIDEAHLSLEKIEHWGLIASARCPGRKRISESLAKFREHGAWSTSPHLIPHCSLHSQSGVLSQALRLHGPNFGAGGMPGAECEAFWAALAMLHGDRLPGVWIVVTGWERETLSADDICCQALVLGLRHAAGQMGQPILKFSLQPPGAAPPLSLESMGMAFREGRPGKWSLGEATCAFAPGERRMEAAA